MEEIDDVELVFDPLVVLGHVPLNGGELSIGVEVAEDGYGNEGEEEEGEGHFEDGDLLVVDVGVDGREDLLHIQGVLQLLDLEHAHILLLLVRHLPVTEFLLSVISCGPSDDDPAVQVMSFFPNVVCFQG